MSSALWLLVVLSAAQPSAQEQPLRLEMLTSPGFGMESGVRMIGSLEQALFLYDEVLAGRIGFEESSAGRRALGITGRFTKLVLLDASLAVFLSTVEHEVFGHGARAREAGQWPTYSLSVPLPYGRLLSPQQRFTGFTHYEFSGFADRDLPMTLGGIEANVFSNHYLALEAFRSDGRIHYSKRLHYVVGKLPYIGRWVDPTELGTLHAGEDPDGYVRGLQLRFNRYGPGSQVEVGQRLRRAYLATAFVDPLWWISLYDLVINYLGRGERWGVIPQLRSGSVCLFPLTRFNLSPFGAEHYLDLMFSTARLTLNFNVRAVSSGLAPAYGLGTRLFRWEAHPGLELGASLDAWAQPELFPEYRNAFDGRLLAGASGMVEATWRPWDHFGLVAQLGGKSRGYVMSQPVAAGFFGFAGIAVFQPPGM